MRVNGVKKDVCNGFSLGPIIGLCHLHEKHCHHYSYFISISIYSL